MVVVADYRRLGWDGGFVGAVVALVEPLVPLVAGVAMRGDPVALLPSQYDTLSKFMRLSSPALRPLATRRPPR